MLMTGVIGGNRDDLLVGPLFVGHVEHADRPRADEAARERRFLYQDQDVEGVTVAAEGVVDEAVVGTILRCGEQRPVESDAPGLVVHHVLVALPFGNLDGDVELHTGLADLVSMPPRSNGRTLFVTCPY